MSAALPKRVTAAIQADKQSRAVRSVEFHLPVPPSLNNLFPGKAHRYISPEYNIWRKNAARMLTAQGGARPVLGPVSVTIAIADYGQADIDNLVKPILDFCVRHGIIEGDGRKFVRELHVAWADIVGAHVAIGAATGTWMARKSSMRAA